jgi:hypothetical protein
MLLRLTAASLALLVAARFFVADDDAKAGATETQFLRYVENDDGSATLETSIARYKDDQGRIVDLIGAVHVGDASYYEQLNRIFRSYDALLYEMVKPKDVDLSEAPVDDPAESTKNSGSWVGNFQRLLKDVLELEFQLDGIDYGAKNFVHADLDAETFFRMQKERGESILTLMLKATLDQMKAASGDQAADAAAQQASLLMTFFAKDQATALKRVLGKQFGEIEKIAAGFEKGPRGEESVLVVERNKACLDVLAKSLANGSKRVGIFYGAAHFPDMERRLIADFGMKLTSTDWVIAWNVE